VIVLPAHDYEERRCSGLTSAIFLGFAAGGVIAQDRIKHLIWIKLGIVLPNNNASYADR
jgi:hypothetical protein